MGNVGSENPPLYVPITLISGILRGAGEDRTILPRGRIGPCPPLVIMHRP